MSCFRLTVLVHVVTENKVLSRPFVSGVIYLFQTFKYTSNKIENNEQSFTPKDDIDHAPRKEWTKGIVSINDCINVTI